MGIHICLGQVAVELTCEFLVFWGLSILFWAKALAVKHNMLLTLILIYFSEKMLLL